MPTEVILPRVDMDMTTGRISRWFAADSDMVEKGQPLFEIETDKAAMEVEAPASGRLQGVAAATDVDLPVGSTVGWILGPDEAVPVEAVPNVPSAPGEDPPGRPRATPLARRLAAERALDLSAVAGSGPLGRIRKADVEAMASAPVEATARSPAPPAADRARSPSSSLHAVWLREGAGPPIVLLHGFGGDLNGWRPFLAGCDLARPVLALDLPGHGLSPLAGPVSFEAIVESVEQALSGAGVTAPHLVGHSLGGAVAARIAAGSAVKVRSLMLLAPAGLGPDINGAFLAGFARARTEASLLPWMRELVADASRLDAALVRATARQRADGALSAAQDRIAGALFPDAVQTLWIRDDLARITAPVKVVFGTADRIIPSRHSGGLPGLIAVHLLPGIGHMPHWEAKADVARLLSELALSAG